MEKKFAYSIGVDLHKDSMTIAVLDSNGVLVERKVISTKCKNIVREYFSSYGLQCQVAVESVGFYQWFWELVRPVCGKLYLADPAGVRACAGRKSKTDRNDAYLLALLVYDGRIPCAYVPEEPVRSLRELVRLRHSLARNLASSRKSLRWVSLKTNLPGPSNFTSDRAQKWILAQEDKFPVAAKIACRFNLDRIIHFERHVADLEREIEKRILSFPELRKQYELIRSIPGIGPVAAATIIVETGNITRFNKPDELSCYAGLCPKVSQSGETVQHGHISKMGPPVLRWVLQQSAWVAIREDENIRKVFNRISRKAGKKKAATAIARKLLIYAWSVCRRGKPFDWPAAPQPKIKTIKDHRVASIEDSWSCQL